MRQLEKEKMTRMEEFLSHGVDEPDLLVNLFSDSVKEEMAVNSKSWGAWYLLEPKQVFSSSNISFCSLHFSQV